jgi:hypothetical protein
VEISQLAGSVSAGLLPGGVAIQEDRAHPQAPAKFDVG